MITVGGERKSGFITTGGEVPGGGGPGSDTTAVHVDVAGEIDGIAEKLATTGGDAFIIEDNDAANAKKKVLAGNLTATDASAVHVDVAGEIDAIAEKLVPTTGDTLLIEDNDAANAKKSIKIGNLPSSPDANAIHDNVAGEIDAVTAKFAPTGGDVVLIEDNADFNNKKKVFLNDIPINGDVTGSMFSATLTSIAGALNHDGSTAGFYGTAPITKPAVTGSRGGNAALASLLTALANLGLITDSTTA
jgi:hypothetical protein